MSRVEERVVWDHWTALMSASSNGHDKAVDKAVELLLSALKCACQNGHNRVVQLLIQAGAGLDVQNNVSLPAVRFFICCIGPLDSSDEC